MIQEYNGKKYKLVENRHLGCDGCDFHRRNKNCQNNSTKLTCIIDNDDTIYILKEIKDKCKQN